MNYTVVIGLEVHVELLTRTKLFCSCSSQFGAQPNSQVCPVCLGLPGSLPVLNSEAVAQAVRAASALGCRINRTSVFARKHYFYPDLPKGYQITQHNRPLAEEGKVDIGSREAIIARLHIEEDSGKLIHTQDSTLVDYNRSGIPLAEIVTTPCFSSPAQARQFLEALKQIMQYTGVSDCKMEEGSLRCDANISLQPKGSSTPGTRTEIKNLNSFRAVERALTYEIQRQSQVLADGGEVRSQTLRWDELKNVTVPMRKKEQALDYRYFPEPDLPTLYIDNILMRSADSLPELPMPRKKRFIRVYGLPEDSADVLTRTRVMADWFEQTVAAGAQPSHAANWLTRDVPRLLNGENIALEQVPFSPQDLARLIKLKEGDGVSASAAKQVLAEMFKSGQDPAEIIRARGLAQISNPMELESLAKQVIADNPDSARDFRKGQEKSLGHLMGQGMKLSQGKANPAMLKKLLLRELEKSPDTV